MKLPFRVLRLDSGGHIARYSTGSRFGLCPELSEVPCTVFDTLIESLMDPDKQIWEEATTTETDLNREHDDV